MNSGNPQKFLVETDIILDHLYYDSDEDSYLLKLMKTGICFTTVLNAAELLFNAGSEKEKSLITDVLTAFKILGLNSRYALSTFNFSNKVENVRDSLIAIVADYNDLTIVTTNAAKYSNTKLNIIHPQQIRG